MSRNEQFLNADVYHLGIEHCSYRSPLSDLGAGQCSNNDGLGTNEKVDAQYQELWGVQRGATSSEPSLYSFLRYVDYGAPMISTANSVSGVYLTDLTFIEDGIPSVIKRTDLINFAKRAKTADVIRDIQQYQNVPYVLKSVPDLQVYILSNMQASGDVHEMYDKSLQVEPREREDEKITRLVDLGLVDKNKF